MPLVQGLNINGLPFIFKIDSVKVYRGSISTGRFRKRCIGSLEDHHLLTQNAVRLTSYLAVSCVSDRNMMMLSVETGWGLWSLTCGFRREFVFRAADRSLRCTCFEFPAYNGGRGDDSSLGVTVITWVKRVQGEVVAEKADAKHKSTTGTSVQHALSNYKMPLCTDPVRHGVLVSTGHHFYFISPWKPRFAAAFHSTGVMRWLQQKPFRTRLTYAPFP